MDASAIAHRIEGVTGPDAELVELVWMPIGDAEKLDMPLVYSGFQLNPSEAQAKDLPGTGDAIAGRAVLAEAGISPGVMKPFVVLVQNGGDPKAIAAKVRQVRGVEGAVAPPDWRKGSNSLVEAFPNADGAAKSTRGTIKRVRAELKGTNAALGGVAGEDRDFVAAVYSNFPY